MYNYDFYSFIDSLDIREYLRRFNLSIAKQAVLIARSKCKSIEEKIQALQYLLDNHSNEEFETDDIFSDCGWEQGEHKPHIVDLIKNTINEWKKKLNALNSTGIVFIVRCTDIGLDLCNYGHEYYPSYKDAYNSLVIEKEETYSDDDGVLMYGDIQCVSFINDNEKHIDITCEYNSELIMYNIYGHVDMEEELYSMLDEWNTFIPLPFIPGDIVKSVGFNKTWYGVFPIEWKEDFSDRREVMTNFYTDLDSGDDRDGQVKVYWIDCVDILSLEYCSKDELPKENNIIKYISDVRRGRLDWISLVNDITTDYKAIDTSEYCSEEGFKK